MSYYFSDGAGTFWARRDLLGGFVDGVLGGGRVEGVVTGSSVTTPPVTSGVTAAVVMSVLSPNSVTFQHCI